MSDWREHPRGYWEECWEHVPSGLFVGRLPAGGVWILNKRLGMPLRHDQSVEAAKLFVNDILGSGSSPWQTILSDGSCLAEPDIHADGGLLNDVRG